MLFVGAYGVAQYAFGVVVIGVCVISQYVWCGVAGVVTVLAFVVR